MNEPVRVALIGCGRIELVIFAWDRGDSLPPHSCRQSSAPGRGRVKADRRRYLLATHGSPVFDTARYLLGVLPARLHGARLRRRRDDHADVHSR